MNCNIKQKTNIIRYINYLFHEQEIKSTVGIDISTLKKSKYQTELFFIEFYSIMNSHNP